MVSKWWHEYEGVVEVVVVDDASVAKMSGGDVDVEPYLDSRNTKGYGTATEILKPQSSNCVGERNSPKIVGLCGSGGGIRKYIWYMVTMGTKFGGNWAEKRGGGWRSCCQVADVRVGPDVRALDPGMNGMNTAWGG